MKNRCMIALTAHGSRRAMWLLTIATWLLLTMACSKDRTPQEKALDDARACAESSYKALFDGQYDFFLSQRAGNENLPKDYREQLLTTYKQFVYQQQKEHGGIRSLKVTDARIDSTFHLIQVFLMLNYADSVQEEIVIPMIEHEGEWKMK